jgi:hypothetical protein
MEECEVTDPRCYCREDEGEVDGYWVVCRVRKSRNGVVASASVASSPSPLRNPVL